ncbi:hypothetical protein LOK49_LG01G00887 [Camellia lanceoleosa]|uniref:Uncharacterized protein n=1 Tax=Camellia lanceoleosa TaxID=1840588 RepID=A0ACC0ITT8_9ERIC|nr:hypothetical protein LOK49_LG01G00887 [Camellia lanceoleosa]
MGLGKGESWDVGKPKSRKKKNDAVEETGCWVRLRFIGSCISSRSKVDSSISGISTHCGNPLFPLKSFYVVLKLHFLIAMDFVVSIKFNLLHLLF